MISFESDIAPRDLQYGRFASAVLGLLNHVVDTRVSDGITKKEIAEKIGWKPSALSRLLSGRVSNVTIKSISDLMWATGFQPELDAQANEVLSPNHGPIVETHIYSDVSSRVVTSGPVPDLSSTAAKQAVLA